MSLYLIIGLGNPGKEYSETYHNAGRIVVETWKKNAGLRDFLLEKKLESLVSEKKIGKHLAIAALPETFMNKSGRAVTALTKKYRPKPDTIIVVHDDADIQLGKIKIVEGRHSAGHKGVESVTRALKTRDFIRIRIGTTKVVTKKGTWRQRDLMKTVIKNIPSSERSLFKKAVRRASEAITMIIEEGIGKSMSIYNQ